MSRPNCIDKYIDSSCYLAANKALDFKTSFALFLWPGEPLDKAHFIANINELEPINDLTFDIGFWNQPSEKRISIYNTITATDYLNLNLHKNKQNHCYTSIDTVSTTQQNHLENVARIVKLLKSQPAGRKIVLSRTSCGKIESKDTYRWIRIALNYFNLHSNTFRYLYFTPETGCWIGASPEILLTVNKLTCKAHTVALAGTQDTNSSRTWDHKNIDEQNQVANFIANTLSSLNIPYNIQPLPDVSFGSIKHNCDRFDFYITKNQIFPLLDSLNPTPALSGYPRQQAIEFLNRYENHSRRCYGGFVSVNTSSDFTAYVNIRCANFNESQYCIFAGGGITANSDPLEEWIETQKKAADLTNALKSR